MPDVLGLASMGHERAAPGWTGAGPDGATELAFFERLRVFMAAFPPAADDRAYQERFEPLGLLDTGESPYADAPADLAALPDGLAAGKQRVEQASRSGSGEPVNGWTVAPHLLPAATGDPGRLVRAAAGDPTLASAG